MFVFDGSGVTGWRRLAALGVAAALTAGALAVWRPVGASPADPCTTGEPGPAGECVSHVAVDESPAASPDDERAVRIYLDVLEGLCDADPAADCFERPVPPRPAREADVDQVRAVLRDLGFSSATVRLSRPGEQTPAGSVVFSVPLSEGCVVAAVEIGRKPLRGLFSVDGRGFGQQRCLSS